MHALKPAAVHLLSGGPQEKGSSTPLQVCLSEYQLPMKEMSQIYPNVKILNLLLVICHK